MAGNDIPDELAMFLKFDPYYVEVPDGFYRERIVMDVVPVAGPVGLNDPPKASLAFHKEPCRIPRYRKELRYGLEL